MDLAGNYKKKGMALDKEDKRILRVKRRSVDQRVQRDNTFMRQRDVQTLAPLKENVDANVQRSTHPQSGKKRQVKPAPPLKKDCKTQAAAKPPAAIAAPAEGIGSLARKEMLQKWKKERELKKVLAKEKEKKKPMFKVSRVVPQKKPTNLSTSKTKKITAPKRNETVKPQPERRVTRASTRTSASKPVATHAKPAAPVVVPTRRTTRQSIRLATSKSTVNSSGKSQLSSKPSIEEFDLPPPSAKNITSDRGQAFQDADLGESFAPANFNFHFQFEPMSPASTQKFLFPETAVRKGRCSTPLSSRRRKREPSPQPLEISAISACVIHSPKKSVKKSQTPTKKHDVSYFRNLVVMETAKLNDLCSKWERVQEAETLNEEVLGEIRSTIGKAQLLIDQRFKQFSGLVDNCEFGSGDKETNPSDLTGFWEMIFFQVEDVHGMFASLDKLQDNNWQKEVPVLTNVKPKKVIKKSKPAPTVTKPNKDRDAARQRLAALKAAMRSKVTRARASEQVVFEGGFFKVESPVRSPAPHCEAGSPFKTSRISAAPGSNTNTPRVQSYTPKNARQSIQGKLCTTLSKLVLGEVVDKSLLSTSKDRMTTPSSKVATPRCKVATPKRKMATPAAQMATPVEMETALPLLSYSPAIHSRTPRPRGVNRVEQASSIEDPLARYLRPSAIPMSDLNDQPEGVTMSTPDLEAEPISSEGHNGDDVFVAADTEPLIPLNNTPCTRSRCKSDVLLAGLNSPRVCRTPSAINQVAISDVFTPPQLQLTTNVSPLKQITNDLICFDSPAPVKTGL